MRHLACAVGLVCALLAPAALGQFGDVEPIWDFQLTGTIAGPTPADSVYSESHPDIEIGPAKREKKKHGARPSAEPAIRFEFARRNYAPRRAFSLSFEHRPEG